LRILILALSGIGDALMFTPAITLLRKALPEARIDAVVMFRGANEIYERNQSLNNVYYFDFLNKNRLSSLKFILSLRGKYDASINVYPSNRKEYNILSFLIGAKKRVAVHYLRMDSKNLGYLNNIKVTEDDNVHNVQANIRLCEKLLNIKFDEVPDLYFPLTIEDEKFADDFLKELHIAGSDLLIGFHPGCATFKNHIKRRWEPEKFAELGKRLINDFKLKILIFGGPDERKLKENICRMIDSSNSFSVIKGSLTENAAVIKRCNVFVTNDSSLMHIAASLKRKVVSIIGPTNIKYIHPWHTKYKVVSLNLDCSPCFIYSPRPLICFRDDLKFKCIKELSVNMVYNAVYDFIREEQRLFT
jgi:heptosyltransferase-2